MQKEELCYTIGIWKVKPGKADEFIKVWKEFAKWTLKTQPDAIRGTLLQDPEDPHYFISIGPWKGSESLKKWSRLPKFVGFVVKATQLCDDIKPFTMQLVARITNPIEQL